MNNINNNSDELNISLIDIYKFLCASKKYCLIGALLGVLFSSIYIASIKPIYQSKITIKNVSPTITSANPISINSEEVKERLKFSKTHQAIFKTLQTKVNADEMAMVAHALNNAKLSSGGNFIEITIKSHSAQSAQSICEDVGQSLVTMITQWSEPNKRYLSKLIEQNRKIIASTKDITAFASFQKSNLIMETFLESPDLLNPTIIDGPTTAEETAQPPIIKTLTKGFLAGLVLALIASYFRKLWIKDSLNEKYNSVE
jgi:capsular polysaccharide biosynthesis protein